MGCFWQPVFKAIGKFFQQNWRAILQIAVTAACHAVDNGAGGPACAALGSFVSGMTSGNLGQALRGAAIAFVTAAAFDFVGTVTTGHTMPGFPVARPRGEHRGACPGGMCLMRLPRAAGAVLAPCRLPLAPSRDRYCGAGFHAISWLTRSSVALPPSRPVAASPTAPSQPRSGTSFQLPRREKHEVAVLGYLGLDCRGAARNPVGVAACVLLCPENSMLPEDSVQSVVRGGTCTLEKFLWGIRYNNRCRW